MFNVYKCNMYNNSPKEGREQSYKSKVMDTIESKFVLIWTELL